jgi:hypothetical protein
MVGFIFTWNKRETKFEHGVIEKQRDVGSSIIWMFQAKLQSIIRPNYVFTINHQLS